MALLQLEPALLTLTMNIENQELLRLAAQAYYYDNLYLKSGDMGHYRRARIYEMQAAEKMKQAEKASALNHRGMYINRD